MPQRPRGNAQQVRRLIAEHAARLMAEEGFTSYFAAKQKAAERLGVSSTRNLPNNREIEDALIDYQRLFQGPEQTGRLQRLRRTAVSAMRFLDRFKPRLVGPVLSGTAAEHTMVSLHLFCDTPEEVGLFLLEQDIPYELAERRLRVNPSTFAAYPSFQFAADDADIELIVFSSKEIRQAPCSPVDGRPMRRATLTEVESLLAESGGPEVVQL